MEEKALSALCQCPLFSGVAAAEIESLTAGRGFNLPVEKGDAVPLSLKEKSQVGIVLTGRIAVYAGETLLNRIVPGGLFGGPQTH